MKQKFVNRAFQIINKDGHCSVADERKLRYGLEGLYLHITKIAVLIIITGCLGLWKEFFLLVIVYTTFRTFGFGIHAKTTFWCWMTTIPIYVLGSFFVKYGSVPMMYFYIIWAVCFIHFLLFAPADTPKRPLIRKHQRIRNRILICVTSIAYLIVINATQNTTLQNLVLYSMIVEMISIHPLTYLIFNTTYRNYKNYQKRLVEE